MFLPIRKEYYKEMTANRTRNHWDISLLFGICKKML